MSSSDKNENAVSRDTVISGAPPFPGTHMYICIRELHTPGPRQVGSSVSRYAERPNAPQAEIQKDDLT